MHIKITLLEKLYEVIKAKLAWDGREKMVFVLCHSSRWEDHIKFIPHSVIAPSEEDYVCRSGGHVKVKKHFFSEVINQAISEQSDIIIAHIHPPGCRGIYSAVDERCEPKLMRHVAEQVNGIYQASIVFSHDFSELDSWYFDIEQDKVLPVEKVLIVGKNRLDVFIPNGFKAKAGIDGVVDEEIMNRTIQAYGEDAVQMIRQLDIGVVGASGLGSPIIEMYARYNFKFIAICDQDIIEASNLNRMVGVTPESIGMNKAEFYSDYVQKINPSVGVSAFAKSFYDEDVQKKFACMDLIMGCVDSEVRFSINMLSLANLIPYFDMGAGVVREKGKVEFKGGQTFSIIPGRCVCLDCSGAYSRLKKNFWSPEKKERERKQGYFNDLKVVTPLVADLDFVIAGLGCHEMLSYIWGFGSNDDFKAYCDLAKGRFFRSVSSSEGCIHCQDGGCLGMGDKIAPLVPLEKELAEIDDIPDLSEVQEKEEEEGEESEIITEEEELIEERESKDLMVKAACSYPKVLGLFKPLSIFFRKKRGG